ncbi:hypothetical protein HDZ31DRAFT_63582 [Schizophyllum fasciatum]
MRSAVLSGFTSSDHRPAAPAPPPSPHPRVPTPESPPPAPHMQLRLRLPSPSPSRARPAPSPPSPTMPSLAPTRALGGPAEQDSIDQNQDRWQAYCASDIEGAAACAATKCWREQQAGAGRTMVGT